MTTVRLRVLMEPRHGARYEEILALALATEEAGFEAFFRSDHLMGVDPDDPSYRPTECWTTIGGLARDTARVRLGALVTAATFREPGLLAAIVASADEMSGGRVELGLGAGWYEREHAAFGIPFPPRAERFDRLEEQLAVVTGLWSGPGFSCSGTHYRIDANRTPPRPAQQPHPPIIVGGSGPRRTPAIAARFATEFNAALTVDGRVEGLRERFARFARACEAIGRDPATARLSAVLPVACGATPAETDRRAAVMRSELIRANAAIGSPAEVTERIRELAGAGADTVYLHIYDIHDLDHIALIGAEVLPHVAPSRTGATA
jgi:F420-dependent oxidoreductase-like protein